MKVRIKTHTNELYFELDGNMDVSKVLWGSLIPRGVMKLIRPADNSFVREMWMKWLFDWFCAVDEKYQGKSGKVYRLDGATISFSEVMDEKKWSEIRRKRLFLSV